MEERTPLYGTFARFYDELGWDRFSKNRAKLILDYIEEKAPHVKFVLDLACGTGEFAMLMAAQGISVTGIDISKDMRVKIPSLLPCRHDPLPIEQEV